MEMVLNLAVPVDQSEPISNLEKSISILNEKLLHRNDLDDSLTSWNRTIRTYKEWESGGVPQ